MPARGCKKGDVNVKNISFLFTTILQDTGE